jgi:hypothetical protein
MPNDTRLQLIDIRQDKVHLKGAAKDASAARTAFMTPVQVGQSPATGSPNVRSSPQSTPAMAGLPNGGMMVPPGPPMPSTPPSPNSGAPSTLAASPPAVQWQDFDIEVPASIVRLASSTTSNQSPDFAPNIPSTSSGPANGGRP